MMVISASMIGTRRGSSRRRTRDSDHRRGTGLYVGQVNKFREASESLKGSCWGEAQVEILAWMVDFRGQIMMIM